MVDLKDHIIQTFAQMWSSLFLNHPGQISIWPLVYYCTWTWNTIDIMSLTENLQRGKTLKT